MGQSLAEAAVRGTTFTSLDDQKRQLLEAGDLTELLALNRGLFGGLSMKLEDDADDDADDDSDDEEDDDADDDDEDDDEDEDKGKGKKPSAAQRRIQELSAESKKHRLRASERGKRLRELEARLAELEGKAGKAKGKDDDEDGDKPDPEAEKLKTENQQLQEKLVRQQLRSEFNDLVTGPKAVAQFKDPKVAFRLLDLDAVEIDEDGDIDGLEDAIKELAESTPYLLVDSKDDEDEDGEDEATKRRRRKTGQPTGGGRKRGNPNREKLVSKYPALRR